MKIDLSTYTVPLRTDVSPSLHPAMIDAIDNIDPATAGAGREALTTVYSTLGKLADAERALRVAAGPTRGRIRAAVDMTALVDAVDEVQDRTLGAIDRRTQELGRNIAGLEARVASALDDPSRKSAEGLGVSQEIRAHVKALGKNGATFVRTAIESGDKPTVAAVLHAPPYLSGLRPEVLDVLRTEAALRFAPGEHAQLLAARRAQETVTRAGSALLARFVEIRRGHGDTRVSRARAAVEEVSK